jgi:hypothetical protein
MFILNCCYAEKSWLMHSQLRFYAQRGRNALILCSENFHLGMAVLARKLSAGSAARVVVGVQNCAL